MRFYVRKMSRRRSRPERQPPGTKVCCFCGLSDDDEVEFGKLWTHNGIVTHYFCLLLSSNMEQNGNDNQGILGFMPADIQKELRRGKRLSCTYCRRAGATLGCCNSRCKRVFHLPCGLRAGSLHQFFGEFRSYCITHRVNQEIDEHIKEEAATAGTVTCYICYEEVNPQNTIRTLWAPCCRKNAWFHRKCVQRLALSAGYFFKCPLCNNKQEFQQAMLDHGIFIPNQDASWELVPNAYQELLHRHNRCDAVECLCPKGRSYTGSHAKWELVLCRLCGSQGIHKACGHLKLTTSIWDCSECTGMLRRTNDNTSRRTRQSKESGNVISEDESSSSSDISVGRNPSPLPITERRDSPSPVTSPIKLRPGPRSFKLQQSLQNARSAALSKIETCTTSTSENRDIPLPNDPDIGKKVLQDEKLDTKSLPENNSPIKKIPPSFTESTSAETNLINYEDSKVLLKTLKANTLDPRLREAEVILIDSDDEVEIIIVKPKQNILTTKDGTKITIHNLSQVTSDPQKPDRDVKLPVVAHFKLVESKTSPVKNSSIPSEKFIPKTRSENTIATVTPRVQSSSTQSHSTVTSRSGIAAGSEKLFGNGNDPDLTVLNEVERKNSVMNLKITNVQSLRHEDFANTIQETNSIGKIDVSNNVSNTERDRSFSALNNDQQLRIMQTMYPINNTLKSRHTAFQLSVAAIQDINSKRKSEEYNEKKNSPNSPNTEVIETRKRARTCDSLQKNANISRNINLNNGGIPMINTSVPLTSTSNSNGYEQSTGKLQVNQNGLLTGIDNRIRMIYNTDTQKRNGSQQNYHSGTDIAGSCSVQKSTNNTVNRFHIPIHEPFSNTLRDNSIHIPKVTRTFASASVANRTTTTNEQSLKNIGKSNTNINDNQQFTSNRNRGQNSGEISPRKNLKQQTLTQLVSSNSSKDLALISRSVYHIPNEIKRYNNESGRNLQKSVSAASNALFTNAPQRNFMDTRPTGSNGNRESDVNNIPTTNSSITQLNNGIPVHSSCDGDAGTSPAAAAGPTHQATSSGQQFHESTEPVGYHGTEATSNAGQITPLYSRISAGLSANTQHHSSTKNTRKCCDKYRLIPEYVPSEDLKFRVLDPKIVQIVIRDTSTINIAADAGNLRNIRDVKDLGSSIEKQKSRPCFTQQSNSSTSKFNSIENDHHDENSLPKIQHFSRIIETPKKLTSLNQRSKNPFVPELEFEKSELSRNPDEKIKGSSTFETKYNGRVKITNTCMNEGSLSGNGSYNSSQRIDSTKEISGRINGSLISAAFESNNKKNSSCILHKENLPREKEMVCPDAFSSNDSSLKLNLCEIDNNIISDDKRKERFSENIKGNPVNIVKYKNHCRSLSSIDFCGKTYNNSSNDKDEYKRSIGVNKVSKYVIRSFDDSSELNLSIDCYNNFKRIVECRKSTIDCSIKASDINVQDSFRNNSISNIDDVGAKNDSDKVLANSDEAESSKCCENTNSNDSGAQAIENISSDDSVSLKKEPKNTVFENQICSLLGKNTSNTCDSDHDIKVSIDLNRIQNFIDNDLGLYDNNSYNAKRKRSDDRRLQQESLPILVESNNFENFKSDNNCLYILKTKNTTQNLQNTEISYHARKRLKYHSEFFKEHSNS